MDVAVVGAGPAGSWAAYRLAARGARVTIFDASHPREKPCGGGVTGRALALVSDAIAAAAVGRIAIKTARFIDAPARGEAVVPMTEGALVVASRAAFDAALLDAAVRAGAVLERQRVIDVDVGASGVDVRTRLGRHRAGFVIGADGANSLVRRNVAGAFPRAQISIATGFFAHGVTSDEIVIELTANPPGYIWSFPRPDHLAIGICAQADAGASAADLRARTKEWIGGARLFAPGAAMTPYSWPIPSLDARSLTALPVAGPRWLLAGDAAGLVDPITREGIYFALASGGWAADAIGGGGDVPRAFTAMVQDDAVAELSRAARLKAGFFRPQFAHMMLHALRESDAIRSVMADLVAGAQSYRTLKWRLLQTLEVGLAWRALTSARRSG